MKKRLGWALKIALIALLPLALLTSGLLISHFSKLQAAQVTVALAPPQPFNPAPQVIRGKPVRVVVASQNIDLTVIDGSYNPNTGDWTLTNDKAQFATNSSIANNRGGNTFIYGHDIPQVFRSLANLKVGDTAEIYTDNGYHFTYKFRAAVDVSPTNTAIFEYSGAPILTLQTCSGIWSQWRHLMTFDFVEATKV